MEPYADENEQAGSGFDPFQLLRIFWRRKWLFFVPFILCLAMAGVAIMVMTPIFFSSAHVRVVYQSTSSSILPNEARYGRRNPDAEALYNIETIVTGPRFLERVAQEFARQHPELVASGQAPPEGTVIAQDGLPSVRRLARRLRSRVRVRQVGRHLFSIGVRYTDPQMAYLLTRVLVDQFLEEERASRLQPRTTTRDFLESQRQIYQANLNERERALTEFERSMLSESLAGNPINEANLARAEGALGRLRSQYLDADAAELFTLERLAGSVLGGELPRVEAFSQDADVAAAMRDLAELEFQNVLGQEARTDPNGAGGLRLRLNQVVEAKTLRDFPDLGVMDRNKVSQYLYHSLYREVRRRVMSRLDRNIQEFRDFMTRQPEHSAARGRLQRDVEEARELLRAIERDINQENLRIEASLSEIGYKMVIHQDPYQPVDPIEPNKVKLGFMSFVLAMALGGGLVVLAEFLNRSFRSVEQIEGALGLPVIGTMPLIQSDYFQRRRQRRLWIWLLLVLIILGVAAVGLLLVYPRLS